MQRHLLAFYKVAKQRDNAPLILSPYGWIKFHKYIYKYIRHVGGPKIPKNP